MFKLKTDVSLPVVLQERAGARESSSVSQQENQQRFSAEESAAFLSRRTFIFYTKPPAGNEREQLVGALQPQEDPSKIRPVNHIVLETACVSHGFLVSGCRRVAAAFLIAVVGEVVAPQ